MATLTAALLIAPATVAMGVVADAAPASASQLSIPLDDDVQARMTAHTGWNGDVAPAPGAGDCVRYGSAADAVTTGPIDNPGGSAGTEAAAWSDGATGWVASGETAYSAHGRSASDCSERLDLSSQSAVGFAPAEIASVQTGVAFNLGRMVHRNNPVYTTNQWFRGEMDVRLLGLDLSYAWRLHETPNQVDPPGDPANNDLLEFVDTVSETTFEGPDGNRYTLVVSGFASPLADGTCAATLDEPGDAINRFETVERTSTYGCLYGTIQQVRTLTVTKVAQAPYSAPSSYPAFGFTTTVDTPGSAWDADAKLTPTALGAAGAASVTRDVVVGETVTIVEDAAAAPWSFTSLACVDGTGAPLDIVSGNTITFTGDLAAADAASAPITCTYTNTFDPRASVAITKTVTPRDGTPADGYTGGDDRVFDLDYVCTFDGKTVSTGTAGVSIGTAATIADIPVGAECRVTGEKVASAKGDFTDGTFRWDGYEIASASATVTSDGPATLAVVNRFVRDAPTPPVTPPVTPPTTPPASAGTPSGLLAITGAGPVLPLALAGAALLAGGALAAFLVRRRRMQD